MHWMNLAITCAMFGSLGIGYIVGHRSGFREGHAEGVEHVIRHIDRFVTEREKGK